MFKLGQIWSNLSNLVKLVKFCPECHIRYGLAWFGDDELNTIELISRVGINRAAREGNDQTLT